MRRVADPGRRRPERRRHRRSAPSSRVRSAGTGRQASSSAWRSRSRARSSSSACSPTTTTCTRRPGTSRSAGWSSRTSSPCSRWCCCRRCSATAEQSSPLWLALALTALKVGALVAFTAIVGTRVIPRLLDHVAAHPVARAVHAHRAGARARHRGRIGARLRRVDGARRVSRRAWSSADPSSACGRRPRRCRCATPSPCCSSCRSACCSIPAYLLEAPGLIAGDAGRRPGRQAAGRAAHRLGAAATPFRTALTDRRSRWRRSASSRSSSSSSGATWAPPGRGHQHAGRRRDRLDRPESAPVPGDRSDRSLGRGAAGGCAQLLNPAAGAPDADAASTEARAGESAPPRRGRRLRTDRADRRPPAPRKRHRRRP